MTLFRPLRSSTSTLAILVVLWAHVVVSPRAQGEKQDGKPPDRASASQPQTLDALLSRIAGQLADDLARHGLGKVGVLEFVGDTPSGESLGADGVLGRYCAEAVERQLAAVSRDRFQVIDRRRLQSALTKIKFKVSDLGSHDALAKLSEEAGGVPTIVLGTLRGCAGRELTVQCKLLSTENAEVLGSSDGVALLNESEWAMRGRSVVVRPEDHRPDGKRPVTATLIERIDRRSKGPHPCQDPKFPFRVKIVVDGKERPAVFRNSDMLVPLAKDEVYEIWIETRSPEAAMMRLLVDGLNTLPEQEHSKGISTWIAAQRVNPAEARPWVLDPAESKAFAVRGFVSETGEQGRLYEFKVVDAAASVAARQNFTDQIGLITAAFYTAVEGGKGPGSGFGKDRQDRLVEDTKGRHVGNLIGVVNIRYVYPEEIK